MSAGARRFTTPRPRLQISSSSLKRGFHTSEKGPSYVGRGASIYNSSPAGNVGYSGTHPSGAQLSGGWGSQLSATLPAGTVGYTGGTPTTGYDFSGALEFGQFEPS